jgi:hypothetical protein
MPYWHRPKFWLILIALQLAAYLLASIIATAIAILCITTGILADHSSFLPFEFIGLPLNIYLGLHAYRFTKNHARRWPQPQPHGFPVIFNPPQPPK